MKLDENAIIEILGEVEDKCKVYHQGYPLHAIELLEMYLRNINLVIKQEDSSQLTIKRNQ